MYRSKASKVCLAWRKFSTKIQEHVLAWLSMQETLRDIERHIMLL